MLGKIFPTDLRCPWLVGWLPLIKAGIIVFAALWVLVYAQPAGHHDRNGCHTSAWPFRGREEGPGCVNFEPPQIWRAIVALQVTFASQPQAAAPAELNFFSVWYPGHVMRQSCRRRPATFGSQKRLKMLNHVSPPCQWRAPTCPLVSLA